MYTYAQYVYTLHIHMSTSDIIIIIIIVIIIIIIIIYCNWVVTRWQWLIYMQTKHEIGYY